jgi:hypothetical protein
MTSQGGDTMPARQSMNYASTANPVTEHIVGWADCSGNIQLGNPTEIAVFNARLPFQNMAKQLEGVLSSLETCRGAAPDWKRFFYAWSVNFWGGVFFQNAAGQGVYSNINPAAKLDQNLRYYNYSQTKTGCTQDCSSGRCVEVGCTYVQQPPFSDVANLPSTCNLATTGTGTCELALNITDWFTGTSFPTGWNSAPTVLKVKFSSDCAGSALPSVLMTCQGSCTASAKSGCCILKEAFVARIGATTCPIGYKLQTLNSSVTDFLFNTSLPVQSKDSTVINFMNLIGSKNFKFSYGGGGGAGLTPFINPDISDTSRSFCLIDGSAFDANTQAWADVSLTDKCPYPPVNVNGNGTRMCPQFLDGGKVTGCGTSCLVPPQVIPCGPAGCPLTPTPQPVTDASSSLSPALALAALGFLCF